MSYNGSGTFLINTSGQPVVTGTSISSSVFNALTADLATGLSTAITKDGQTATTARIPFAQGINSTLVTDSTSTTTGSIITAGGAGVAKALFVGTTANVAGAVTFQSTLGVTGITTFSAQPIFSSLTASSAVATDASKGLVSVTNTGTGNNVLATSPTLVTPALGTPSALVGTNITGTAANFNINGTVGATTATTGAFTTLSATGVTTVQGGTAALPAITTAGDTNTGIFFPAADTIAFSEGGAEAMRISAAGNVGIGTTSPTEASSNKILTINSPATFGSLIDFKTDETLNLRLVASGSNVTLSAKTAIPILFETNSTERARIPSAGGFQAVTTISVGNATPSASGAGITFPASQSASSDANTLDDYEEGTWTPSLGGTATYSLQEGNYTKIGRMVNIRCNIVVGLIGTGSVTTISGLPFTAFTTPTSNPTASGSVGYFDTLALSPIFISLYVASGATTMNITGLTAASNTANPGLAVFGNSARIDLTVTYFV